MTLRVAVDCLESLKSFVESKRDAFETYEEAAKTFSRTCDFESVRARSSNVRLQYLDSQESQVSAVQHSARDKFRIKAFLPVIDKLMTALNEKILSYKFVVAKFNFMASLLDMESSEIAKNASKLVDTCSEDLEATLSNELIQLKELAHLREKKENEPVEIFLYRIIKKNRLHSTFFNAEIVLRLYLSMMVRVRDRFRK